MLVSSAGTDDLSEVAGILKLYCLWLRNWHGDLAIAAHFVGGKYAAVYIWRPFRIGFGLLSSRLWFLGRIYQTAFLNTQTSIIISSSSPFNSRFPGDRCNLPCCQCQGGNNCCLQGCQPPQNPSFLCRDHHDLWRQIMCHAKSRIPPTRIRPL